MLRRRAKKANFRGPRRDSRIPFLVFGTVAAEGVLNLALNGIDPQALPAPLAPLRDEPGITALIVLVFTGLLAVWHTRPSKQQKNASRRSRARVLALDDVSRARQDLVVGVGRWLQEYLGQYRDVIGHLDLRLMTKPGAVDNPWFPAGQTGAASETPGAELSDVVSRFGGQVLVLGGPGAGKTRLMLELAQKLLEAASNNPADRVPVVFQLSSWRRQRRSFASWMARELQSRYRLSRQLSREFVMSERLFVLLDGLDEVPRDDRPSCVAAINKFLGRSGHKNTPVVVGVRSADYEELPQRLSLHTAVEVQGLSRSQVMEFLSAHRPEYAALHATLLDDAHWLWDIVTSPLGLSVAALAYRDRPVGSIDTVGSEDRLYSVYVDEMLRHGQPAGAAPALGRTAASFSRKETLHWLSFLARNTGPEIFPDALAARWLPARWQRAFATLGVAFLAGLVAAAGVGLPLGFFWGLSFGLSAAALAGVATFAVACWPMWTSRRRKRQDNAGQPLRQVARIRWSWQRASRRGWRVGLPAGIASSLCIWIATCSYGLAERSVAEAVTRATFVALTGGLLIGLADGLAGRVFGGLLGGTYVGFAVATLVSPSVGIAGGLAIAIVEFAFGLTATFNSDPIRTDTGTWPAMKVALTAGALGLFAGAALGALAAGLPGVLFGAIATGLAAWLRYGGAALVQYRLVRFLLVRAGLIPRDFLQFLDYADSRRLLRRVGGGYQYFHEQLRSYLANRAEQPGDRDSGSPGQRLPADPQPSQQARLDGASFLRRWWPANHPLPAHPTPA